MENKVKEYIKSRGGSFISLSKVKQGTHWRDIVTYKCAIGHLRENVRSDSLENGWCPDCCKNTIEDARTLAASMNGKFLSEGYTNSHGRYLWECENGHQFEALYYNVNSGKWCQQCRCYSIEDMQKLAESRGGKCLSVVYYPRDKMEWECKDGHQWEATSSSIVTGGWCSECSLFTSERVCRKILEFIYKKPFQKLRPEWLLSVDQTRLELDGYCEELSIAYEYNGVQHYKQVPYFHVTGENFEKLQQSDKDKVRLCAEHNVKLIVIPYTVKFLDLYVYIRAQCLNLPPNTPETIGIEQLDLQGFGRDSLQSIQTYLDTNYPGSKILSQNYLNNYTELDFKCAEGHEIKRTWAVVQAELLCTICSKADRKRKHVDTKVAEYCKKYKLTALTEYQSAKANMSWKCNQCGKITERCWDTVRRRAPLCPCNPPIPSNTLVATESDNNDSATHST